MAAEARAEAASLVRDAGRLLVGERLTARGDEGLGAVDADVFGKEAGDEARDGGSRAHDDVVVAVNTTNGVETRAGAGGLGELVGSVARDHGPV
jgi:hypothetical protein